jgi:hypothetical protein
MREGDQVQVFYCLLRQIHVVHQRLHLLDR